MVARNGNRSSYSKVTVAHPPQGLVPTGLVSYLEALVLLVVVGPEASLVGRTVRSGLVAIEANESLGDEEALDWGHVEGRDELLGENCVAKLLDMGDLLVGQRGQLVPVTVPVNVVPPLAGEHLAAVIAVAAN